MNVYIYKYINQVFKVIFYTTQDPSYIKIVLIKLNLDIVI